MTALKPLFDLHDLPSTEFPDHVEIGHNMSGLEEDPRNDWLHVALSELQRFQRDHGSKVESAAFIGSANGIDVVAALRLFEIQRMTVTDILPEILPTIEHNIRSNTAANAIPTTLEFVAGRDCDPISGKFDLIYANLPLIMADPKDLEKELATTTLTDANTYASLQTGAHDILSQWSLLPQLGFLLSAKDKLASGGSVITLIGGRIPDAAIDACFDRAGMDYQRGTVSVMRQSDEEYVAQYAAYESKFSGDKFEFFDEERATEILESKGHQYPSIISASSDDIRSWLLPAQLSAEAAWAHIQRGNHVGHLAVGFTATRRA